MGAPTDLQPPRHWWSSAWVKFALSLILIVILLLRTDRSDLVEAFSDAEPGWVIAALAVYLASMIVSAVRWAMLSRPLGFAGPLSQFVGSFFVGMYMNLFAPSTVAGDISRALYLAGGPGRRALAFTTVLADRGLGLVVLVWINALAILLLRNSAVPAPLYYSAWIVPPATLLAWLYGPQLMVRLFRRESRWRQMVERDLAPYWKDFRLLTATSAVAAVFHLMQISTQMLLARALGLHLPWSFFFIFVPLVNIAGMLPISFSGIGIREYGYVLFLARFGIVRHTAVALGLLSSGVVLASGLCSGLVYLFWNPPPVGMVRRPRAASDEV